MNQINNISRIQRVSRRFRIFFAILIFTVPMVDALFWLFFYDLSEAGQILLPLGELNHALSLHTRLLLFLTSLVPVGVVTFGMLILARLFHLYENGFIFSAKNVKYYRTLGYIAIAWTIAEFIFIPLSTLVVSQSSLLIPATLAVGFRLIDMVTLVIGVVVILISWVMDEGRKLADESAYIV